MEHALHHSTMKRYGLYWLRAITLGAGLNALIVSTLMSQRGWKFHQAAPIGAIVCINLSFAADRMIFGRKPKVTPPLPKEKPYAFHACPVCSEYPCVCENWDIK